MQRNIALYPLFQALRFALVWQAVWFLYFQGQLSGPQALVLAATYDLAIVMLEVPSGYLSDLMGRRLTLILAMLAKALGCSLLFLGDSMGMFIAGQALLGLSSAFASGTDSALLYESLAAQGKHDQVAVHEANAWRWAYWSLAASAVLGGVLSLYSLSLPYVVTALAAVAALCLAWSFREPDKTHDVPAQAPLRQLRAVAACLRDRVLLWVFVFAVFAIVLEDVPYIYLQPFVEQALRTHYDHLHTPLVTGVLIGVMMGLSAIASRLSLRIMDWLGAYTALLCTLAAQVALVSVMALWLHPVVAVLLVLRMVPSALSHPMMMSVVQPRLSDAYRATYLSFQNLSGRAVLSATVLAGALAVSGTATIDQAALGELLPYYALGGWLVLLALGVAHIRRRRSGDD